MSKGKGGKVRLDVFMEDYAAGYVINIDGEWDVKKCHCELNWQFMELAKDITRKLELKNIISLNDVPKDVQIKECPECGNISPSGLRCKLSSGHRNQHLGIDEDNEDIVRWGGAE